MNQIYVDGFSQWRSLEMIEILFSNDRFGLKITSFYVNRWANTCVGYWYTAGSSTEESLYTEWRVRWV